MRLRRPLAPGRHQTAALKLGQQLQAATLVVRDVSGAAAQLGVAAQVEAAEEGETEAGQQEASYVSSWVRLPSVAGRLRSWLPLRLSLWRRVRQRPGSRRLLTLSAG